jgi:hypothetical protein
MALNYILNNVHVKAPIAGDRNPHMLYDMYLMFVDLVVAGRYDWVWNSEGTVVDPGWTDAGGGLPTSIVDQDFFVVTPHDSPRWYLLIGTWDGGGADPDFLGDAKGVGTVGATDGVWLRIGAQWNVGANQYDESLYESSVYYKLVDLRPVGGDANLNDATPLIWNIVEDQETVWMLFHYYHPLHWDTSRGGFVGYITSVVDFPDYLPIGISTGLYMTRDSIGSFLENPIGGGDELNHMSIQAPYKTVGVYTMAPSHYVDVDGVSGHTHSSIGLNETTSGYYIYIYAQGAGGMAGPYYPVGYLKYIYQFYGFGPAVGRISNILILNNVYSDWCEGVSFPIDDTYGYE